MKFQVIAMDYKNPSIFQYFKRRGDAENARNKFSAQGYKTEINIVGN